MDVIVGLELIELEVLLELLVLVLDLPQLLSLGLSLVEELVLLLLEVVDLFGHRNQLTVLLNVHLLHEVLLGFLAFGIESLVE